MAIVFIAQQKLRFDPVLQRKKLILNFTKAKRFGELKFIADDEDSLYSPEELVFKMRERIQNFNINEDSLLLVGDPIILASAAILVSKVTRGKVPFLRWEKGLNDYHRETYHY